jgi:uncharacterized membrane protein YkvA (DUF1232 family)
VVHGLLIAAAAVAGLYVLAIAALVLAGRRGDVRAVAGFVPDCLVRLKRLLGDPRVDRRRKALLAGAVAYLATPIDLVPDVIPIAGQLDDAIVVALALRAVLRAQGGALLDEHWPGPLRSREVVRRLVGYR